MTIGIIGESCVGKSTIANALSARLNATVYTGKDYLKLAKNEAEARQKFVELLNGDDKIIYVITDREHVNLLPQHALRVVVTADIDTIKVRFAKRMNGNLPPPVAAMLEKIHGVFDELPCDLKVSGDTPIEEICDKIAALLG